MLYNRIYQRVLLSLLLGIAILGTAWIFYPSGNAASSPGSISLKAPEFMSAVHAAEANSITSVISDEAGISGYFQASGPIDLNAVRGVFLTIETETDEYILGSVPVRDYTEYYSVHVYVHKDGWLMAYYLTGTPVAKIVDIREYANNTSTFTTIFENVLSVVAGEAGIPFPGVTHYDFRYPNATHMMIIGETNGAFNIKLPSSYGFFERSYSIYGGSHGVGIDINGVRIDTVANGTIEGTLTAAQLLPDTNHSVNVVNYHGALVLVYQVP